MAQFDQGLSHALKSAFPLPAKDEFPPALAQMLEAMKGWDTQGPAGQAVARAGLVSIRVMMPEATRFKDPI